MIIIYRGLGWLVPFLYIAPFIVIGIILQKFFGFDVLSRTASSLPLHTVLLLGAALTFVVGSVMNRIKIEEVIYEKSQTVVIYQTKHTLYYIPMQYWALIGLAIHLAIIAYRSFR